MKQPHSNGTRVAVPASAPVRQNIQTIARLESEQLNQRSTVERIGDVVGAFAGSMLFVVLHVIWFATWFTVNTNRIPGVRAFDPYPFIFLSMAVSVEAVLLSTFVLMKQNSMSRRSDRRSELNLQIDLLSEKEITKALQLLIRLSEHVGLERIGEHDEEARQLSEETAVEGLAEELKNLPGE